MYKCVCSKSYKHKQSLYNHKKTCNYAVKEEITEEVKAEIKDLKNQIKEVVKLVNQKDEIIKILVEKVGNTTNNTNNNNITININQYLDKDCKDAITMKDLDKLIKDKNNESYLQLAFNEGIEKAIASLIVDSMSNLTETTRPLHIMDEARGTVRTKTDIGWTKDIKPLDDTIKNCRKGFYDELINWQNKIPVDLDGAMISEDYIENVSKICQDIKQQNIIKFIKPKCSIKKKLKLVESLL